MLLSSKDDSYNWINFCVSTTGGKLLWMGLGVVLILLVLFYLLLFSNENPISYLDRCPCWNANKEQEDPKPSGKHKLNSCF